MKIWRSKSSLVLKLETHESWTNSQLQKNLKKNSDQQSRIKHIHLGVFLFPCESSKFNQAEFTENYLRHLFLCLTVFNPSRCTTKSLKAFKTQIFNKLKNFLLHLPSLIYVWELRCKSYYFSLLTQHHHPFLCFVAFFNFLESRDIHSISRARSRPGRKKNNKLKDEMRNESEAKSQVQKVFNFLIRAVLALNCCCLAKARKLYFHDSATSYVGENEFSSLNGGLEC